MTGLAIQVHACGPFFPNNLLDAGEQGVLQPPIADFERELQRMNLPSGRLKTIPAADGQSYYDQSTEAEMTDLAAALKQRKVMREQAMVIMQAHLAQRMKLGACLWQRESWGRYSPGFYYDTNNNCIFLPNTNPPPEFPGIVAVPGLPREFADYFAGTIAWYTNGGWSAAEKWKRVLDLPERERHFKSTWAAFMLGEYYESLTNETSDKEAIKYYEQVVDLAKKGFADSAGLAVFGLGEEARIWVMCGNYERALELYLEQFAAGGASALNSLRFTATRALAESNSTPSELRALAKNPRTRRVVTAYLISRHPYLDRSEGTNDLDAKSFFDRTDNWLEAVDAAGVKDVESAEQLALAAYQGGDMDAAQRWVSHAPGSTVAQWLQAKLFLRAGKLDEAATLLAKVSRKFPTDMPGTNAPPGFAQALFVNIGSYWEEDIPLGRQTLGELGAVRLARREYTEALDALLRSGYWMDAAYVAESVLTTGELKIYVDRHWRASNSTKGNLKSELDADYNAEPFKPREQIRYLLARRIARESGAREALAYYPTNFTDAYATFLDEIRIGRDESFRADLRAKNLFAAAVIERESGMELFGTELSPDWAIYGGSFEYGFGWQERATNQLASKVRLASADEIDRASSRKVDPDRRFHYRWRAAELAWTAAQLMPNNTDETARMLCAAGTWLKYRDPEGADKFYKALVRRCRETALGKEADSLRWFPAQPEDGGPPRLETIQITAELTNTVARNSEDVISEEFPFPGRKYSVHENEDVYVIARAVQRLGCAITADAILRANPGLTRGPLPVGVVIVMPEAGGKLH